jgi:hypothetical protein
MTYRTGRNFCSLLGSAALLALAGPTMAQQDSTASPDLPTISMGQTVQGEITASAPGCATNPRARMWRFDGRADERIEITMQSEQFDTLVELGRMNGCEFESLATNDDGAGPEDGLNSRLTVRLRENGSYVIRALSFSEEGAGSFQLAMTRLPPPPSEPAPRRLAVGDEARGELTIRDATIAGDTDSLTEGGRPYHFYTLTGRAGEVFNLALDSDAFDPVLEVGVLSPLGYSVAQYNDDGGGPDDGFNSRLTVTFRSAGSVVIRVSPLGAGTGAYRLRATRGTQ